MEEPHSSRHVTEETAHLSVGVPVSPSKAHPQGPHLPDPHGEGFILLTHEFMGSFKIQIIIACSLSLKALSSYYAMTKET